MSRIGFIGGGNMARALIGGLIAKGWPASDIAVADPSAEQREMIAQCWPDVMTTIENGLVVTDCDALVLAVKPQVLSACVAAMATHLPSNPPLIISIAAGVRIAAIQRWFRSTLPVVRCMPNTPALVSCGASALYASPQVDADGKSLAERILQAVGIALWVRDESELDAVTALSGSGPAYFFYVLEALEAAGVELGLSPPVARTLSLQTALGASRLATESDKSPAELRAMVTSKGGTTERALGILEQGGLKGLFNHALVAAKLRAQELADESESNA